MLKPRASLPAGQDQEDLFREEVFAARRQSLEGDVIVRSNRWLFAGTLVLLAILAITLILLCFADVPRIEQSRGWLTTTRGLVHVEAFRVGVVEQVAVVEGQHVGKGAALATIRVENMQWSPECRPP